MNEACQSDPQAVKVCYINLGCRVNRVEIDDIAFQLEQAGFAKAELDQADVVVINTCAVTGEAEAKTRKAIRHAASAPGHPQVIAIGCVVSLFPEEIEALGDNIQVIRNKADVPAAVIDAYGSFDALPGQRAQLGELTPTGRTRPGVKIQDGCDNKCTYCIVWKARGKARSLSPESVVEKVRQLEAAGAREVVLTGINLAAYSWQDWNLARLLQLLMERTGIQRFRLSSMEPPETTDELLQVIGDSQGRIAPFLHLALQSGCDKTLAEMGRHYDTETYARVVRSARERIPNVAIGCDMIVGFPGETDEDFQESLDFARSMAFDRMHVFRYSQRPGTPAADRCDQVPSQVKSLRAKRMRDLAFHLRRQAAEKLVGTCQKVLTQNKGVGVTGGLYNCFVDTNIPANTFVDVQVIGCKGDNLIVKPRD